MASITEHCRVLLAAIIPDRRDLLDKAITHLTPEHFPDRELHNMFSMLKQYRNITSTVIRRDNFSDLLRKMDIGSVALYEELYDSLEALEVDDSDFRWSLQQIRELAAEKATKEALSFGMEIVTKGREDEKGNRLEGHADCRTQVLSKFAEIERNLSLQESPAGDMKYEADDIINEYAEVKKKVLQGRGEGIQLGIPVWDEQIGGLHEGFLSLIAGYSGAGKSSLIVQIAWNAYTQGKNVVLLTSETVRTAMRSKLISRHSRSPQFGLSKGIDSQKIITGRLNPEEEKLFAAIADDFSRNPMHGHLEIIQMPKGSTVSTVNSELSLVNRKWPVELCEIDDLRQLRADRKRNSEREEQMQILKDTKQLAVTFDDGRGISILSPWQVNRNWRDTALNTKRYDTRALSETAEATNISDAILSLLEPDVIPDKRRVPLIAQSLKLRYGGGGAPINLIADMATCYYVEAGNASSMDTFADEDSDDIFV